MLLSLLILPLICAASAPPLAHRFDARSPPPSVACPFNPDSSTLPTTFPPFSTSLRSNLTALEKLLSTSVANNTQLPSVIASLSYNGQTIWTHGAGETKIGNGILPNKHTKYRIGSVSKIFPVLQLYKLSEDTSNDISLETPFSEATANRITFVNHWNNTHQPTLRQMASQRAGLPRVAPCYGSDVLLCNVSNEEMIQHINKTTTLKAKPGGIPSYSNLAFALLGNELAPSGTTFAQWVQQNILNPLNLTSTGFGLDVNTEANAATGYAGENLAVGNYHLGWNMPCGGMSSSVEDLNTLSQAIMNGTGSGLFQVQGTAEELMAPVYLNPSGKTMFGTPWEMYFHSDTGYLVRRKGGNVPGYTALVAFVPELKVSLSVLWSGQTDEFGASRLAFDHLLNPINDMLKDLAAKEEPLQPENPSSFVGTFSSSNLTKHGSVLASAEIFIYENKLLLKVGLLGLGIYLRVPEWVDSSSVVVGGSTMLQMWVSRTISTCFSLEMQAFIDSFVVFDKTLSTFSIPGLVPGYFWERTA